MAAPPSFSNRHINQPNTLKNRLPVFEFDRATRTYNCYQSFNFVQGYEHLSFEELHLRATMPPQPKGSERFGVVSDGNRQILKDFHFKQMSQHLKDDALNMLSIEPPMITIRVGTELDTKDFCIHENILLHCSPYFRTALKSEWRPESGIVPLEDDPAAFKVYNEWVYSGRICTFQPPCESEDDDTDYQTLTKAWIMGDKFLDNRFKNAITDAIVNKFVKEGRIYLGLPDLIYTNTFPGSPLRKLLLDLYWYYGDWEWMKSPVATEAWNEEFYEELVNRVPDSAEKGKERESSSKLCRYHEHLSGEWCDHGGSCYMPPRAMGPAGH